MYTVILKDNYCQPLFGKVTIDTTSDNILWCYIDTLPEISLDKKLWLHTKATSDVNGNAEVVLIDIPIEELLAEAKEDKIAEIMAFDKTTDSFKFNGIDLWMDKEERGYLMDSMESMKDTREHIPFIKVEKGINIMMPIPHGLALLKLLNNYAADCAIKTKQHIIAVNGLTTLEAVNSYDYRVGYPDKLTFNL